MKKIAILIISIVTAFSSVNAEEHSRVCRNLATITDDSIVETQNITDTLQAGSVFLKLVSDEGEVIFEEKGVIIGRIKRVSDNNEITFLDHTMYFDDGSTIKTFDDSASFDISPEIVIPEGSIPVIENITKVRGTKFFRRAQAKDIAVKGYITPPEGQNYFEFQGSMCLRKRRHHNWFDD